MALGYKLAQAVKPTVYTVRYPRKMAGKPLLYISSALASLGDALLGYSQGITAAFQVQPSFIQRIYGTTVTPEQIKNGTAAIPPLLPAILIACLSVTALFAALVCVETSGKRLEAVGGIFGDPLPPPRMLEMEDEVVQVLQRRRRGGQGRGRAALSVPSLQLSAAGHSAVTLYPSPSVAGTSEVTLRSPLLGPELGEKSRTEKAELASNNCSEMGVEIGTGGQGP